MRRLPCSRWDLRIFGKLTFSDAGDRALIARQITVEVGGVLQIGTKEKPFQHKQFLQRTSANSQGRQGGQESPFRR